MAYSAGLALGLRISQNFNHRFLAPNVVLFWRCWHMSLERFLGRYVLEADPSLWRGRNQSVLLAGAIFMVSARWHSGTLNNLVWGLFHGAVYFVSGQWLRRHNIPAWLDTAALLLFFVFGRLFVVDADGARLLAAGLFLALEVWSTRRHPHRSLSALAGIFHEWRTGRTFMARRVQRIVRQARAIRARGAVPLLAPAPMLVSELASPHLDAQLAQLSDQVQQALGPGVWLALRLDSEVCYATLDGQHAWRAGRAGPARCGTPSA